MIPILILRPHEELSADQIVLVASGELKVLKDDGEKIGIILPRKDRALLKKRNRPRVSEVFR
jgi:hypothetical protein